MDAKLEIKRPINPSWKRGGGENTESLRDPQADRLRLKGSCSTAQQNLRAQYWRAVGIPKFKNIYLEQVSITLVETYQKGQDEFFLLNIDVILLLNFSLHNYEAGNQIKTTIFWFAKIILCWFWPTDHLVTEKHLGEGNKSAAHFSRVNRLKSNSVYMSHVCIPPKDLKSSGAV